MIQFPAPLPSSTPSSPNGAGRGMRPTPLRESGNGMPGLRSGSTPSRSGSTPPHAAPRPAPFSSTAGQRGCTPLPSPFRLQHGGVLEGAHLSWELCGDPCRPLVAVLGGISADGHVCPHAGDPRPGWWPGVVGPGAALDPARYRILGIDYLAGPGESSGPAADGRSPFPVLTPADQASALAVLLDHLGVPRLRAIVGGSYGGMVALSFASLFPGRLEGAVVLAAAHEPDPLAAAVRAIQRRIVKLGIETGAHGEGLALARALALTTYRSREEFRRRFPGEAELTEDGEVRVPAEDYLDHQGERFLQRMDPARYLALTASIDLHRVDPGTIRVPVALAGFQEDALVPPDTLWALARRLPAGSTLTELASRFGHDGFLKEVDAVGSVIRRALAAAAVEASR
jgi:homoserine O-acetyltransferase/O-succinyltransferase